MASEAAVAGLDEQVTAWARDAAGRPRRRLDTATVLETTPFEGSLAFVCAILAICLAILATVVKEVSTAPPEWQARAPIMWALSAVMAVLSVLMLLRVLRGGAQYRDEATFAGSVFEHVLGQPAAPNMHMYQRVCMPGTLGRPGTEPLAELRAWMADSTQRVAAILFEAAGVDPQRPIYVGAPITAADAVPTQLISEQDATEIVATHEVPTGEADSITVWEMACPVQFRFRPQQTTGRLNDDGDKLAATHIASRLRAVICRNGAGDWYLLQAEIGELTAA